MEVAIMSTDCLEPSTMTAHPGRTFQECFRRYFDDKIDTDVSFMVGEDKIEVKAHKMVLQCRSPVFSRMFNKTFHDGGDIEIKDTSPEFFTSFLGFIYTDEVEINEDNAIPLLHLSDKYDIPLLFDNCIEFLNDHINVNNACLIFAAAKRHNSETLKMASLSFICMNDDCLRSEAFLELSEKDIVDISGNENLSCREEDLFESLCKWAELRCEEKGEEPNDVNKRQILGDIIFTVRFPLMEYQYLISSISKGRVLTDSELKLILQIQSNEIDDSVPCTSFDDLTLDAGINAANSSDSITEETNDNNEDNSIAEDAMSDVSNSDDINVDAEINAGDIGKDYADKGIQESYNLFNRKTRKAMQPENVLIETGLLKLSMEVIQEEQILSFSVSENSWLYGIIMYGPETETRFGYELSFSFNNGHSSVIAKVSSFITSNGHSYACAIPLDAPLLLKESESYKCSIMIFSKPLCRFYRRAEIETKPATHLASPKGMKYAAKKDIEVYHLQSFIPVKQVLTTYLREPVLFQTAFRHKELTITERSNHVVGLMLF